MAILVASSVVVAGCGNSNVVPQTFNPYTNNGTIPGGTTGTQTGGYTTPINGGTKTLIPVLTYPVTFSGTRQLPQTAQVNAGDQIIVSVYGGYVLSYGSCFFGGTSQAMLSSFTVQLNGQTLGSSAYATYTASQAGTLTFQIPQMTQVCGSGQTTYQVSVGQGVYLGRCTSTAGAAMTCPY